MSIIRSQPSRHIIFPSLDHIQRNKFNSLLSVFKKYQLAQGSSISIEGKFIEGQPSEEIIKIANSHPNQLTFFPLLKGLEKFQLIFGSLVNNTISGTKTPIMLIPDGYSYKTPQRILFCSADVEIDIKTMSSLSTFAKHFDCSIEVVHFNDDKAYSEFDLMNAWKSIYPKNKLSFNLEESGSRKDMMNAILKYGPDIIAYSYRNHNWIDNLFGSKFSTQLKRHSRIPLFVV